MDCTCPNTSALTDISPSNCDFNMNQIQRLGFQRRQKNVFTPLTILDLSEWQANTTATDDTKIVFTPFVGGDPVIEPGDAITTGGGDNSTLNGVEERTGVNPSVFSAMFKSLTPKQESEIKKLMCEKELDVYFILQGGRIAVLADNVTTPTSLSGFEIESFFFGDRGNQGYGSKDTNAMRFSLPAGWSEKLTIYKPTSFNPLTDL